MDWAICHTCHVKHRLHPEPDRQWPEYQEFALRHVRHRLSLVNEGLQPDPTGWRQYTPNANNKMAFGGNTAITCTLASLATASARCSAAVDNSSNLYLDAWLYLAIKLATGTPAGSNVINVYGYSSEDGSNYIGDSTSEVTGSDAGITLLAPSNMKLLGVISVPASATGARTFKAAFSVATGLGTPLWLPNKWGFIVDNETGLSLDSTEGNHTKQYNGVYSTSI